MIEVISYLFIFIGLIMIITAVVGCNRLPGYFCKMHAATVGDAVGCPFVLIGIAIQSEFSLKIIILVVILLIVNPAGSYMLNRFALTQKD
tara:strand:+ start:148 stop:417 length:270 start_codon:yes stop_codon:yes gene_type:complete